MIYIENEYSKPIDIDYEVIAKDIIDYALEYINCPYECEINLTIVDNDTIREINKEAREIDKATDVLSFPMLEYLNPGDFSDKDNEINFNPESGELILGDIIISYDKVIDQSSEYGHSKKREFAFLVAHSMLHLFGFDHMTEDERLDMENRQNEILNKKGYTRDC